MPRFIALLAAALALFISPILMAGGGMAMAHAPAAAAQMDAHCRMMPTPQDSKGDMLKIDCAAACSALFGMPPALEPRAHMVAERPSPVVPQRLGSLTIAHDPPPPRYPEKS